MNYMNRRLLACLPALTFATRRDNAFTSVCLFVFFQNFTNHGLMTYIITSEHVYYIQRPNLQNFLSIFPEFALDLLKFLPSYAILTL